MMSRSRIATSVIVAGLFAAAAVALSPLFAQGPASASSDEAAIKEVVRKYVEAREARDPKTIEPLLTADADQLVSDGTWRRGRDNLVRGMLESSRKTGGRRDIVVGSVRMLANDVALADGRYTQTGLAGGRNREMWTAIVLKRGPDGWRIAAIRNMLPAAPAGAQPPPEKKDRQSFRYEAEDGLPRDAEGEKRRDYAVLEAALNDLASPKNPEYQNFIRNAGPRRQIVVDDTISDGGPTGVGDESHELRGADPQPIPADLGQDLLRRNGGPPRSLSDFRPANPDILVRDLDPLFEQAAGPLSLGEAFEKQYPDAWGYVIASRPGYSRDGNLAIVVFDAGPHVGHGMEWTYMLSRKGKRWDVQWRHLHVGE